MLKVPSFDMNTSPEMFVSLVHCVIDDTLFQALPDLHQTLLHFIDVLNLMSDANACPSIPREVILAFNVTHECTNN